MSPPRCCHAAATALLLRCCHRCRRCAAAAATISLCYRRHAATATTIPWPPCCCRHRCYVAVNLLPLPLPPCCRHRPCCRHHQAAAAAAKLPPPPLCTLWDRFDDVKELYKMTDVDFFQLSQVLWLGVKFLHGRMLSIFDALVYLSLNCIRFQLPQWIHWVK